MEKGKPPRNWDQWAERRLNRIMKVIQTFDDLRKKGPKAPWWVTVKIVGEKVMISLNATYRGKKAPTDILSFPSEYPFRDSGLLGELVVCLPVLKEQAKSLGHTPRAELDVLLTHGVLHLLGFDHEKGARQAAVMAKWESEILNKVVQSVSSRERASQLEPVSKGLGLINRVKSDIKKV